MRVVYSIDWDHFTGALNVCCDPTLCGFPGCQPFPRTRSLRSARTHGYDSGQRDTVNRLAVFFQITSIRKGTPLIVAENHASIYRLLSRGDRVYDWDAHVDEQEPTAFGNSFRPVPIACSQWRYFAKEHKGVFLKNHYHPRRKVPAADLVFLCQSRPWTPKDQDHQFYRLISRLARKCKLRFMGNEAPRLKREWKQHLEASAKLARKGRSNEGLHVSQVRGVQQAPHDSRRRVHPLGSVVPLHGISHGAGDNGTGSLAGG